jgi:hypothetical protein
MVAIVNLAYTSKINPPGATPVLTRAQVWAGLQRKIRFAQEFVPIIDGCEVLKDDSGVVERIVKFKKGMGPRDEAREVVRGWEDCWVCICCITLQYGGLDGGVLLTVSLKVDFEQDDGTHVRNVISNGPSGDDDLHMTYMFEFRYPNIEPGSEEAEKQKTRMKGVSAFGLILTFARLRLIRCRCRSKRLRVASMSLERWSRTGASRPELCAGCRHVDTRNQMTTFHGLA